MSTTVDTAAPSKETFMRAAARNWYLLVASLLTVWLLRFVATGLAFLAVVHVFTSGPVMALALYSLAGFSLSIALLFPLSRLTRLVKAQGATAKARGYLPR